jgi:alpha,alpha-trehalase
MKVASQVAEHLRPMLFHEIASAAETGWDFSSRWMKDDNSLTSLQTSYIIPGMKEANNG